MANRTIYDEMEDKAALRYNPTPPTNEVMTNVISCDTSSADERDAFVSCSPGSESDISSGYNTPLDGRFNNAGQYVERVSQISQQDEQAAFNVSGPGHRSSTSASSSTSSSYSTSSRSSSPPQPRNVVSLAPPADKKSNDGKNKIKRDYRFDSIVENLAPSSNLDDVIADMEAQNTALLAKLATGPRCRDPNIAPDHLSPYIDPTSELAKNGGLATDYYVEEEAHLYAPRPPKKKFECIPGTFISAHIQHVSGHKFKPSYEFREADRALEEFRKIWAKGKGAALVQGKRAALVQGQEHLPSKRWSWS